eukprot:3841030-Pyramimonas_sp.AAC.1
MALRRSALDPAELRGSVSNADLAPTSTRPAAASQSWHSRESTTENGACPENQSGRGTSPNTESRHKTCTH